MRNRPLDVYERQLHDPNSAETPPAAFVEMCKLLHDQMGSLTVVDLGCGDGQAILSLVSRARVHGIEITGIGIDKEINKQAIVAAAKPHALSFGVLDGYLAATEANINVRFIQSDLDYEWPLQENSAHLVFSNKAVMFLRDKVRLIENVWASLVLHGRAILEVDVGEVANPTPRISTPKPFLDLVVQLSATGFNIRAWQSNCPLADAGNPANITRRSCVLGMMRNRHDLRLSFGTEVVTCEPFQPAEQPIERWGMLTTYRSDLLTGLA